MARKWKSMTDEEFSREFEEATRRGLEADRVEPRARSACYDSETRRVVVELKNGCLFAFPVEMGPGLEGASPEQLAEVEPDPSGEGLHWEELDADVSLPGMIVHALNVRAWAAKFMGQTKSEAKARAARENGKKGGRPRKEGS